jgi:hypothetical protein
VTTTPGTVRLERDGHVAILTLDRPAKLNAMSVDMDRQMNERVFEINNDDSVRSVLLTGAPGRAFCVGSDIEDLDGYGTHWQYRNRFDARLDYARAVWLLRKPWWRRSTATASAAAWRWPAPATSGSPRPTRRSRRGGQVGLARRVGRHPAADPARRTGLRVRAAADR